MSATEKRNYGAAKQQLSCRVTRLVKSLIALERKSLGNNASEADALESLVLRASTDAAASQLILKEAASDPQMAALVNAIRALK